MRLTTFENRRWCQRDRRRGQGTIRRTGNVLGGGEGVDLVERVQLLGPGAEGMGRTRGGISSALLLGWLARDGDGLRADVTVAVDHGGMLAGVEDLMAVLRSRRGRAMALKLLRGRHGRFDRQLSKTRQTRTRGQGARTTYRARPLGRTLHTKVDRRAFWRPRRAILVRGGWAMGLRTKTIQML